MKSLFLIPARGGSKGIPKKNVKLLNGRPLIYYTLDCATSLTSKENICVSTDDDEIIRIVESYGISVPFVRPSEYSTDTASQFDVIRHALRHYRERGQNFDNIVLLQPTSPLRQPKSVIEALDLFQKKLDMVVSVNLTDSNPYYVLFEENKKGYLKPVKKATFVRRQDCPDVWQINGAIYVINTMSVDKFNSIREFRRVRKYVMNEYESIDIDTSLDLEFCEFLMFRNNTI